MPLNSEISFGLMCLRVKLANSYEFYDRILAFDFDSSRQHREDLWRLWSSVYVNNGQLSFRL